jgi:hypothetical protein
MPGAVFGRTANGYEVLGYAESIGEVIDAFSPETDEFST